MSLALEYILFDVIAGLVWYVTFDANWSSTCLLYLLVNLLLTDVIDG